MHACKYKILSFYSYYLIILHNYTRLPILPQTLTLVPRFTEAHVCAGSANGQPCLTDGW